MTKQISDNSTSLKILYGLFIPLITVSLCAMNPMKSAAQNVDSGASFIESVGLQVQTIRPSVSRPHDLNHSFGIYARNPLGNILFGEVRGAIGMASGDHFKTRYIPVDYRLHARFSRNPAMSPGDRINVLPFAYVGAGSLFLTSLEVPVSGDPQGGTHFLNRESGAVLYIPAGVGLELQLDPATNLDVHFGYQHPIQAGGYFESDFRQGFWGLHFGLRFSTARRESPGWAPVPPPPALPLASATEATEAGKSEEMDALEVTEGLPGAEEEDSSVQRDDSPAESADEIDQTETSLSASVAEIEGAVIQFPVLSTDLNHPSLTRINRIAHLLKSHESVQLKIAGHTDSSGPDVLNELLSESRARTVWLNLMDRGAVPSHAHYQGFADSHPVADDQTSEGRALNRRVDLQVTGGDTVRPDTSLHSDRIGEGRVTEVANINPITEYTYTEPLFPRHHISFRWMSAEPVLKTMDRLKAVRDLLRRDDKVDLMIVSVDDSFYYDAYSREVSKARAEWIRAWLISEGVAPGRLQAYGNRELDSLPRSVQAHIKNDRTQQVLLIPLVGTPGR